MQILKHSLLWSVIYTEKSLYELKMELWSQSYKHWVTKEFLSFPWFFNIAFLLVLYVVWIKLVDKRRLRDLLLFGSLIAVAATFMDIIAVTTGLWHYNVRLFPISPAPFPFDFTVIPIFYMLVMQYTSTWRGYLIGSLIASGTFSFIVAPVYVLLKIKEYHKVNHFFVFILIFVMTSIIKAIYNWIVKIEHKNAPKKIKKLKHT